MKDRNWTELTQVEWLLEMQIARFAELISAERKREIPDQEKINTWLKAQASADDLHNQVSLMSKEKVAELLEHLKIKKDEGGF
ncbi:hypothetical protein [Pseudomonas syringae group genomosp. 3]|uniref:hypothetical protein n=1 Tax=Pseudomonas syringae group genomosp. 3 TaxID=251701 RepID=UPI0005CA706A|nr:hypothetical protein [Pseudomonas syringae group genomosp. 3]KPB77176.1 Unknown protein sequence [Pseudomonas syringae pv. maculicola str. M6]KPX69707.1 Unknown protein sequence [Pseudomonas syringae pv. maculicola]